MTRRSRLLGHALASSAIALTATLMPGTAQAADEEVMSGTVTSGGQPVAGVWVTAWMYEFGDWERYGGVVTDASGRFAITHDEAYNEGNVVIGYQHPDGLYFDEFYNNVTDPDDGTSVTWGDGISDTNLNADLDRAGVISGRVTNEAGAPLPGIDVRAGGAAGYGGAETDAEGNYIIGGLDAGAYELSFYDPTDTYVDEYWNDQNIWDDTQWVTVPAHTALSGYDATLTRGGYISGTVTDPAGAPLGDVYVDAYQLNSSGEWQFRRGTGTNPDGSYRFRALRPGAYRICFIDVDGKAPVYAEECWDNQPTPAAAASVAVTSGVDTKNISSALSIDPPTGIPTTPTTPTSPPAAPPAATPPSSTPPVVAPPAPATVVATYLSSAKATGKLKVGKTLKLTLPTTAGVTAKVQWYAGKKAIKKATKTKLKLTAALKGKVVSAKVKATTAGTTKTRTIKLGKVH